MNLRLAALPALLAGALMTGQTANGATVVFSDNFNSYTDGNLVGQGGWVELSAGSAIQVGSGSVVNMSGGEDAQKPFSSSVARLGGEAAGQALITEFDIRLTSAAANDTAGDFFAHLTVATGNTTMFNRFYARAGTAPNTFQLAVSAVAVASPAATNLKYGGDLTLGQTYHVQSQWDFIPGLANDKLSLNVNGAPYVAKFDWDSGTAEPTNLGVFNLRQGGTNAPGIASIDNVVVTLIPEPATLALAAFAAMGVAIISTRRKA